MANLYISTPAHFFLLIKPGNMHHIKSFLLFLLFILFIFNLKAQKTNDYNADWNMVAGFEKKGLTQSALKQVILIFNKALAAGNEAQQIKSAMYQMKYRNMVEEDNSIKNIFYLDTLITRTRPPARNILQSMQAEILWNYRNNHRYELYNQTALLEENSTDIETWSLVKLNEKIASLYKASIKEQELLLNVSLKGFDAILEKGNSRQLRPTLYDLLANRALVYFTNEENTVTQPSYKFIINDSRVFTPAVNFIQLKFITKDSTSLYLEALKIYQGLLKFHLQDVQKDALLDADLSRLEFVYTHGVFADKYQLYEKALINIESNYNGLKGVAEAMYLRAQLYVQKGNQYNPLTNKSFQFELRRAVELCTLIISKYPGSEGAIHAQSLLAQLKQPSLVLQTEKANIPNLPFKTLVTYRNTKVIYFRVFRTNREEIKQLEKENYEIKWKQLVGKNAVKSWSVTLPDLGDYQAHSTEIKIDGLPAGTYYILAGLRPDFNLSENILARMITYVTDISYIINNNKEFYVLDRNSGKPLPGAEVQLWSSQYNYSTRNYIEIKKEKYIAGSNGHIQLQTPANKNQDYNNYFQVTYRQQELFTNDSYYTYEYYNRSKERSRKSTFLFTDRSIYRPGQIIYFKGIMVAQDSLRKAKVVTNTNTTVVLYDANHQPIQRVNLTTNEYGSYNGRFTLPSAGLAGQFSISDSVTRSASFFNVEEYKRPKFQVLIDKPAGTYRLNDSVKVTGNAKAYAGNSIGGAIVSYRVIRKVRYPIWLFSGYKIWPPYKQDEVEITNGITVTDEEGSFSFNFKAIPDETADRKNQPVFHFEVIADVTDINGETRSATTSVAVSYQALQLTIEIPEAVSIDSVPVIMVKSTNINDVFEQARVTVTLHELISPGKIFRERYWSVPDMFVMNRQEYESAFPEDAYADEDQVTRWPAGAKKAVKSDTTSVNGNWQLGTGRLSAGWYKLVATSLDKYGDTVRAEKFFEVVDPLKTTQAIQLSVSSKTGIPGQNIKYNLATGYDSLYVIHHILKVEKPADEKFLNITSSFPFTNKIMLTENDRGGVLLSYAFVKHNRAYNGKEAISVPWDNKDLQLTFETFRDKLYLEKKKPLK